VHARLGLFQQVTMPATVKGTSLRKPARSMPSERRPISHTMKRAPSSTQASSKVSKSPTPALRLMASRCQSVSGGGGPSRARMPAMVKNSTAGLLTASAAAASASA
jgi:hypothetical protein